MEIKKILCPLDFSKIAQKSLDYAVFMAFAHNAELQLLHVVDQLHGFDSFQILALTPNEIADRMETEAIKKLSNMIGQIKETLETKKAVRHGKASVKIIEMAREMKADLIVMGSHGRTGLSHVVIGSVAEAVVRHASCPVLVTRDIDR